MTKAGLVQALHEQQSSLTKTEATRAIETILDVLKESIIRKERVLITNFGSFEVLARAERRGRNPATGEIIQIRPRRTVVFRAAQKLEVELNATPITPSAPPTTP